MLYLVISDKLQSFASILRVHVCVYVWIDSNTKPAAPGEPNGTVVGYSHGLAVKTGLQLPSAGVSPDMVNQFGKNYLLALPQRTMAGGCTWSAPVQFLVESSDFCDVEITSKSCSEGSQLDARMYAPSAGWGVATGPLVLHKQAGGTVTKTDVNFLCADGSMLFIKSTKTRTKPIPLHTELCFAANESCSVVNDCYFNATTSAYVCPDNPVFQPTAQPGSIRCSFDSGFTVPPKPHFDALTGICSNAVVAVTYNFTWSGQTITHLNATVTLADISAVTNATNTTVLSQHFAVTFVGSRSQAAVSNSSSSQSTTVYPPSGNPGKSSYGL